MTELRNKPLVEAILEVRWRVAQPQPGQPLANADFPLLLGRFYDRIRGDYASAEVLPAAGVPDALVAQIVQHRFRVAPNAWPLLQIGSGILTVNETSGYTWPDFRRRAVEAVQHLFDANPNVAELAVEKLTLRYLDAITFDPEQNDLIEYLRNKLQLTISLPNDVFDIGIVSPPKALAWQASYPCTAGDTLVAKIATGKKGQVPSIILDTAVEAEAAGAMPHLPDGFGAWIDSAHEIASGWFKKLTSGELYASFEPVETVV